MCPHQSFIANKCSQMSHSPPSHSYLLHSTVDQRAMACLGGSVHHNAFSELRFFILTHVVRAIQGIKDSWTGNRRVMSGPGSTPSLPSHLDLSVGLDDFLAPKNHGKWARHTSRTCKLQILVLGEECLSQVPREKHNCQDAREAASQPPQR